MTGGTIRVYVSNISSTNEQRHRQQHIISILEAHKIDFDTIDIADPVNAEAKTFMRENSVALNEGKIPLPPQIFNEDVYCGNYDRFSESLEDGELFEFLKLAVKKEVSQAEVTVTGGRPSEPSEEGQEAQEKAENGSGDAD